MHGMFAPSICYDCWKEISPDMLRYKTRRIWFIVMVLLVGSMVGASLGGTADAAP
jgi:hypothetical protein